MSYTNESRVNTSSYSNDSRVNSSAYSGFNKDFDTFLLITEGNNVLNTGGGYILTTDDTYGGQYTNELRNNS